MEIKLDGWKCNLMFSSAHFLADYSKCSRLHGHTYAIHAKIHGDPVDGILIDFRIIKEKIRKVIEEVDHKVIIPLEGRFNIKISEKEKNVNVNYDELQYSFPLDNCALLPIYSSSAENLCQYILMKLLENLDDKNINKIEIGVDEGYGQGAWIKWEKEKQSV